MVRAYRHYQKELLPVVHQDLQLSPEEVLGEYPIRWKIERLFQNLTSSGFDLDKTSWTRPTRLNKHIATMALATFWALKTAHLDFTQGPSDKELPLPIEHVQTQA